jgi:hypothetical protein
VDPNRTISGYPCLTTDLAVEEEAAHEVTEFGETVELERRMYVYVL